MHLKQHRRSAQECPAVGLGVGEGVGVAKGEATRSISTRLKETMTPSGLLPWRTKSATWPLGYEASVRLATRKPLISTVSVGPIMRAVRVFCCPGGFKYSVC